MSGLKCNGMTDREILTELHTDLKWVKKGLYSYKKITIAAKDRSLKNELDIKNFKQTATFLGTVITILLAVLTFFKDTIGGLFK